MHSLNKNKLKELLSGKLPGQEAQYIMAPPGRPIISEDKNYREAAVLILIYPQNGKSRFVLIKRNEYEGHHSGQISFPGGIKEASDKDYLDTALRETEEEIGIQKGTYEILGHLTPLFIPVSRISVHPFVAWIDDKPRFTPNQREVQYLILPDVNEIRDPNNIKLRKIEVGSKWITVPCYELGNEIIWGATAMMLKEFTVLLDF